MVVAINTVITLESSIFARVILWNRLFYQLCVEKIIEI